MARLIESVLFDLDETLTDRRASLARYAALFHGAFAGRMRPTDVGEILATFVSLDRNGYRPRDEVYAGIADSLRWDSAPEPAVIGEHWRTCFPRSAVARTGLRETLAALANAGIRLGVVTNGSELAQSTKLAHLGIDHYFSAIVISGVVRYEKPDPRIYACALTAMGCSPASALFVGDHPVNDVLGSSQAGLIPVWFEGVHAWPAHLPEPSHRIRSLPEVLRFFGPRRAQTG